MGRKLYRCMSHDCTRGLFVFDTEMQLHEHWERKHGMQFDWLDIDEYRRMQDAISPDH